MQEDSGTEQLSLEEEQKLVGAWIAPDDIIREYDMTHWYQKLADANETFRSIFIPLETDDLRALDKANSANYRGSSIRLTEDQTARLKSLETRLDEAIASLGGQAFVKLNTRSPKDAVVERKHPRMAARITQHLDDLQATDPAAYQSFLVDGNKQMILVLESASEAMRSKTGAEALELLTNSSRVQTDVKAVLRSIQDASESNEETPKLYLIAREWVPAPLSGEYRVFVCRRKITAAAQYFHMCYWPHLVQEREKNEALIRQYVQKMLDEHVKYENCVIDVALHNGRCYVIEINPFHFSTGAPLYGWKQGSEERKRLLYGPYELRVCEAAMADAKDRFMATVWSKMFAERVEMLQVDEEDESSSASSGSCTIC
eukprot:TRINITY_DN11823_c0_g1_i1.p2 TRINITY_DN11823_c0_g1~~TRINITY_DN11823_c0_g1_i1.p2  ORF type:complete len:373 (-),score=76.72 TRINITY_DN11823_c0_g1_i1:1588-2706(-)